jgi:uncharacterized protein YqeY
MNEITIKIRNRIKDCMKQGLSEERDILKTVLGEAQSINLNPTDVEVLRVLKKSKQGCIETLPLVKGEKKATVQREIDLYNQFLPTNLSVDEIKTQLENVIDPIKNAKSDGQATGVAMGFLKKNKMAVDGKEVAEVVKELRSN